MLSGFDGSPGALGLTDATSKAGAAGVCPDTRSAKAEARKRTVATWRPGVLFMVVSSF
jgi:hypothetical protein